MLKISKKVEYALMSLKYIADHTEISGSRLISAREICDEFNTPFDTTAKVMQLMNNNGLLKSVKGIKGGYTLLKDLNEVTYMELVRLIECKEEIGRLCSTSKGQCELYAKCNIIKPVDELNKKLNQYLETITLGELLLSSSNQFNTPDTKILEASL